MNFKLSFSNKREFFDALLDESCMYVNLTTHKIRLFIFFQISVHSIYIFEIFKSIWYRIAYIKWFIFYFLGWYVINQTDGQHHHYIDKYINVKSIYSNSSFLQIFILFFSICIKRRFVAHRNRQWSLHQLSIVIGSELWRRMKGSHTSKILVLCMVLIEMLTPRQFFNIF